MSTLLGSMNARGSGPSSRPSHPVDAALWGLAERLAGGAESAPAETVEKPIAEERPVIDLRAPQVRVVRLPQRAGGLPSVGRMGQRNRTAIAPAVGVPTKPITSAAIQSPPKPSAPSVRTARKKQPKPESASPKARRAEFTILKGRNSGERPQPDPKSSANSEIRQESPSSSEESSGDSSKVRRVVRRKRRAGVTIFGWLALTTVAVAAAAIALFWPSWF